MTRPIASLPSLALAVLAGLAHAASLAAPGSGRPLWWLQWIALALFSVLVQRAPSWRRAALTGWVFATAWLCGTFWWLYISMHTYGGLPAPLAALAVFALAAFLASYYAFAAGLQRWLAPEGAWWGVLAFPASWTLAELLRARWFTGFPWGAAGYAHVEGPLAGLAPWVGSFGIGFFAALFSAFAADLVTARGRARGASMVAGAAMVVVVAASVGAPAGTDEGRLLSIALLQGNIPQEEKFQGNTGIPTALSWYAEQLTASRASLTVAPETAIPLLPQQLPPDYLEPLVKRFQSGQQAALIGIPLGSFEQGYTNSVVGLKPGTNDAYRFDKHHLVPFGEFIPPLFRWFTDLMNIPLGDFNRGAVGQPSFQWQGQRLAPNVCYEDLFGEELAARFTDPARAPTIFVNVSNIGWFGDSVAIDQHLHISRMRALEFDRPIVRATNTGATAIVDHQGRVLQVLPRFTRAVLTGEVQGRTGTTPFAWWASRFGLWPLWAAGLAPVLGALWRWRRGARP